MGIAHQLLLNRKLALASKTCVALVKSGVIKEVRSAPALGLKEAKDFVAMRLSLLNLCSAKPKLGCSNPGLKH